MPAPSVEVCALAHSFFIAQLATKAKDDLYSERCLALSDPQGGVICELTLTEEDFNRLYFKITAVPRDIPLHRQLASTARVLYEQHGSYQKVINEIMGYREVTEKVTVKLDESLIHLNHPRVHSKLEDLGLNHELADKYNRLNKQSIIPFSQEIFLHAKLKLAVLKQCIPVYFQEHPGLEEDLLKRIAQEAEKFALLSLKAAIEKAEKQRWWFQKQISIGAINRHLDSVRDQVPTLMTNVLLDRMYERDEEAAIFDALSEFDSAELKHLFESTPASSQDFISLMNGIAVHIVGSESTAHGKSKLSAAPNIKHDIADRPIWRGRYKSDSNGGLSVAIRPKILVRVPSINVDPKDISLPSGLSQQDYEQEVIEHALDVSCKLQVLAGRFQSCGAGSDPLVYNLLTSFPSDTKLRNRIDSNNKQRFAAERIIWGAHFYNAQRQQEQGPQEQGPLHKKYVFMHALPVNQHGNPVRSDSSDPLICEAALMADIAKLYNLQKKFPQSPYSKAYEDILEAYEQFLAQQVQANGYDEEISSLLLPRLFIDSDEGKFVRSQLDALMAIKDRTFQPRSELPELSQALRADEDLPARKEQAQIQRLLSPNSSDDLSELASKAYAKLFHSPHSYKREYGMLVQTLAELLETECITGCKSANEREECLDKRVEMLEHYLSNDSEFTDEQKENVRAHLRGVFQAFIEDQRTGKRHIGAFKKQLDLILNDVHLYASTAYIAHSDMGAASKAQSQYNQWGHILNITGRISGFFRNLASSNPMRGNKVYSQHENVIEPPSISSGAADKSSKMQAHKGMHKILIKCAKEKLKQIVESSHLRTSIRQAVANQLTLRKKLSVESTESDVSLFDDEEPGLTGCFHFSAIKDRARGFFGVKQADVEEDYQPVHERRVRRDFFD